MLSQKNRLPAHLIGKIIKKGKKISFSSLTLFLNQDKKIISSNSQFAIIIGKKTFKNNVLRNRYKRQIKEAIRNYLPFLKNCQGVILAYPRQQKNKLPTISREVKKIFQKAGLFASLKKRAKKQFFTRY